MLSHVNIYLRLTVMAWRNVIRNWRHSLATLFAIACAFIAISLFDGYLSNLHVKITEDFIHRSMMGHIIIEKKDAAAKRQEDEWAYSLTKDDQRALDEILLKDARVKTRIRLLNITGILNSGANNPFFVGYGYDIKEGTITRGSVWEWNAMAGLPLHLAKETGIVIGSELGESIDCTYPERTDKSAVNGGYEKIERIFNCPLKRATLSVTTEFSQVNTLTYPIVGIVNGVLAAIDRHLVQLPLEEAQKLLDTDKVSMMTVLMNDKEDAEPFINYLKKQISKQHLAIDVTLGAEHTLASYMSGALKMLTVFRNLFMSVLMVIGIMSVINTMTKSVNERIREIGTLRSLGFLRHQLVFMFAIEGFFLSILACAVGFLATIAIALSIDSIGFTYNAGLFSIQIPLYIRIAPQNWISSALLFGILATASAWSCSRSACRMVIADAMRYVE